MCNDIGAVKVWSWIEIYKTNNEEYNGMYELLEVFSLQKRLDK